MCDYLPQGEVARRKPRGWGEVRDARFSPLRAYGATLPIKGRVAHPPTPKAASAAILTISVSVAPSWTI